MTEPIHCPGCGEIMTREDFARASVDVCTHGCRGIWFARGELRRMDHQLKGFGPSLRAALAEPANERGHGLVDCPHCRGPMDQVQYEFAQDVTIDECKSCGGIFLDSGELAEIRKRPLSVREQRRSRRRRARRLARKEERADEFMQIWFLLAAGSDC